MEPLAWASVTAQQEGRRRGGGTNSLTEMQCLSVSTLHERVKSQTCSGYPVPCPRLGEGDCRVSAGPWPQMSQCHIRLPRGCGTHRVAPQIPISSQVRLLFPLLRNQSCQISITRLSTCHSDKPEAVPTDTEIHHVVRTVALDTGAWQGFLKPKRKTCF